MHPVVTSPSLHTFRESVHFAGCTELQRGPLGLKPTISNDGIVNSASHWQRSDQREAPLKKNPSIPNNNPANSAPHWHAIDQ